MKESLVAAVLAMGLTITGMGLKLVELNNGMDQETARADANEKHFKEAVKSFWELNKTNDDMEAQYKTLKALSVSCFHHLDDTNVRMSEANARMGKEREIQKQWKEADEKEIERLRLPCYTPNPELDKPGVYWTPARKFRGPC